MIDKKRKLNIDCHCHFSADKAYKIIDRAMDKGIDFLAVTDFSSINERPRDRYVNIIMNQQTNKFPIFPTNYKLKALNEYSTLITRTIRAYLLESKEEELVLFNTQEIDTLDGHIVALCTRKIIKPGEPLKETAQMLKEENIPFIISHPYAKPFGGVGEEKIMEIYEEVTKKGFALEDNGQISKLFEKWNLNSYKLAHKLNLAVIASSDGHLEYPFQWKKVSNLHSEIPRKLIIIDNLKESLLTIINKHPNSFESRGKHRSTFGTFFWIGCQKLEDAIINS